LPADFLAGIFIIYENQYRVGDIIELNRTGITGTVEAITIRTTVLRDEFGNVHHVPNGTINFTTNKTMDYSNINFELTVAFETDLQKLEKTINKIGADMTADESFRKKIIEAPHLGPISNFDPNGLVIKVLGKVAPSKQWEVSAELRKRIVASFAKEGIAMPFQKAPILTDEPPKKPKKKPAKK
jgi:moderate conductance mechanosensitive channel